MAEVSMIVPVYQVEKYIAQCIESVLNQTFQDFELILIDDGSKDTSGIICDSYAAKDDRIIVIHSQCLNHFPQIRPDGIRISIV